jgi:uncharacterized LabA/DUF88 family protein
MGSQLSSAPMRVGVYVDGFNLYYGARKLCGRGTEGWRWLDIRALVESTLPGAWRSQGATLERIVYCTARVSGVRNPSSAADQAVYIRALQAHHSVDAVEFGNFVSRAKFAPLVRPVPSTYQPAIVRPEWPLMLKDSVTGADLPNVTLMVSYLHQEEKGSDVNVGTHLMLDVLQEEVDAAIVVSNDSDLKLPIREARKRVPLGIIKPGPAQLAGDLRGTAGEGAGGHWWGELDATRLRANQLPDPVDGLSKPNGW